MSALYTEIYDAAGNPIGIRFNEPLDLSQVQTVGPAAPSPVTAQAPASRGLVETLFSWLNKIPGIRTNDGYRAMFLAWALVLLVPGGLLIWFLFFRRKKK